MALGIIIFIILAVGISSIFDNAMDKAFRTNQKENFNDKQK